VLGYESVRQNESYIYLITSLDGTYHVATSNHRPLKTATLLGGFLKSVTPHHKLSVEELLEKQELQNQRRPPELLKCET
jgi:hypothetical protein